jgi:hypothetical protein
MRLLVGTPESIMDFVAWKENIGNHVSVLLTIINTV